MAADRHEPLRVGISGLGTVGIGVVRLLLENRDVLQFHCPRPIEIVAVSARDRAKDRGVDLSGVTWLSNPLELASHPNVNVVIELIGGSDGPAKALVEAGLANSKHVVTANKALLAHHGTALAGAAEASDLCLAHKAAAACGNTLLNAMGV